VAAQAGISLWILALSLLLESAAARPRPNWDSLSALAPARPITKEIRPPEVHSYRLALSAGGSARIVVEQRGVDVAVIVRRPDQRPLIEMDLGPHGREVVSLIAETAGLYAVEIRALQNHKVAGQYRILLAVLRSPLPGDRLRAQAESHFAATAQLAAEGSGDSLRRAVDLVKTAARLWRRGGAIEQEARALNRAGAILHPLGEYQRAHPLFTRALQLSTAVGPYARAESLRSLGLLYGHFGEHEKALRQHLDLLPLWRQLGDPWCEATTLRQLGASYRGQEKPLKAMQCYRRALALQEALGDRKLYASLLHDMGLAHLKLSEPGKAVDNFLRSLDIYRALGDSRGEAAAAADAGLAYSHWGKLPEAIRFLHQAIPLQRKHGDLSAEAWSLLRIAEAERDRGNFREALVAAEQAGALRDRKSSGTCSVRLPAT